MKVQLVLLLLLGSFLSHGQVNLVPNPSFEQYTSCPDFQNQIDRAVGWSSYGASPEYFNSCSPNSQFSTPYNWGGYQEAATGNAYAGLYTLETPWLNVREYIGTQLIDTLVIGYKYNISFSVNLSITTDTGNYNFNTATNNLGIRFSTVPYSFSTPPPISNYAHLVDTALIMDTTGWTTISGSFIADSAYIYMAIGNFYTDSATVDSLMFIDTSNVIRAAYYFIDDIEVVEDSVNGLIENGKENVNITIFPNPATDYIKINIDPINDFLVRIYSRSGLLVKEATSNIIQLSELDDGLYYVRIETSEYIYDKKLIINKSYKP